MLKSPHDAESAQAEATLAASLRIEDAEVRRTEIGWGYDEVVGWCGCYIWYIWYTCYLVMV